MIHDPQSRESGRDGRRPLPDPDPWWYDGARRAIEYLAATKPIFTADDLFEPPIALPAPPHPAYVGSAFAAARAARVIVPVGIATSYRPSRNGGLQRAWSAGPAARQPGRAAA